MFADLLLAGSALIVLMMVCTIAGLAAKGTKVKPHRFALYIAAQAFYAIILFVAAAKLGA